MSLFESINVSSLLIVGAVGTYVLGFLFRNQIYIRLLVVIGGILYIWYYWVAGPEPLWDAILGSFLIAIASAQGVMRLIWSRMPSSVGKDNRDVFALMPGLEPGLFNQLMRVGDRIEVEIPTILTREGALPEALWFLVKGELSLERAGQSPVSLSKPGFVGEIAWMLRDGASATVIAQPGARLVRWSREDLTKVTRKSHRLELALEAAIANDIAKKLARSRPIEDPKLATEAGRIEA